ncbi:uncharacterized protein LOC128682192 [Plodia interpunctella]|uniref:uncharacterized protein LOC128682192 n=1 Tax=Plodia interpunctella TaxID=58824 RepID=UPI002367B689|nr:uncharacterized protein LOC128682192 [Plodia interpunctella]
MASVKATLPTLPTLPNLSENPTEKIYQLANIIIEAINQGKSVTAPNKKLIVEAAEAIKSTTIRITSSNSEKSSQDTPNPLTPNPTIQEDTLRRVFREELEAFHTLSTPSKAPTYASLTAKTPTKPAILVKTPTPDGDNAKPAIQTLREQISFKDKNFAPSKITQITKDKLIIEVENPQQQKETLEYINQFEHLQASIPKKRKPLIIAKGIHSRIKREELIQIITTQNTLPTESIRLCYLTNNRNPKLYNAVLEVDPSVYARIIGLERIAVDLQRVHVAPQTRFIQCHSCLQFGHTKNKCTSKTKPCAHCASPDHQIDTCPTKNAPESACCYNCAGKGQIRNIQDTQLNLNHSATDHKLCPRIRAAKNRIEEATDFGY